MIAHAGYLKDDNKRETLKGPIAVIASETIASFAAVTEMLATVGQMAISYGVGHPLAGFQALLHTYRTLLKAEAALTCTAEQIVKIADLPPKPNTTS
jgi:hypothetical protein